MFTVHSKLGRSLYDHLPSTEQSGPMCQGSPWMGWMPSFCGPPRDVGLTYFGKAAGADLGHLATESIRISVHSRHSRTLWTWWNWSSQGIPTEFTRNSLEFCRFLDGAYLGTYVTSCSCLLGGAVTPGHAGQYYQRVLPAAQAPITSITHILAPYRS